MNTYLPTYTPKKNSTMSPSVLLHHPLPLVSFLIFLVYLLIIPPVLSCPSQANYDCMNDEPVSGSKALDHDEYEKVDVTLYYETLCPYCSDFIANHLIRIFTDRLVPIVNLRLVPWGNSRLDQNSGSLICQHGEAECLLNTVEACAINVYPDLSKHFSFIQCIEGLASKENQGEWQSCFKNASIESKPIYDCYNNGQGYKLDLQYASETSSLNPPHAYVPWLLVNNQPLHQDYKNFVTYVCKAYRGDAVPSVCSSATTQFEEVRSGVKVGDHGVNN